MRDDPNDLAEAVLEECFGDGLVEPRDVPGAPPRTPDFALVFDDHEEAVEVTRVTQEDLVAAQARARALRSLTCPNLDQDWVVYADRHIKVRAVKGQACTLLQDLIDDGRFRFDGPTEMFESPVVSELWRDLGLEAGYATGSGGHPGTVSILSPGDGGVRVTDALVTGIEAAVAAKVNKNWGGATRRHVMCWVDEEGAYIPWRVMVDRMLPDETPDIDKSIDVVWAATRDYDGSSIVWRWSMEEGWVSVIDNNKSTRP